MLGDADCDRRLAHDLLRQFFAGRHEFFRLYDFLNKTDASGFLCADDIRRVDQILGHAFANQSGESLGAAESRNQTQTDFRLSELRLCGCDADIARHGQLAAAAQRKTIHRCDDRLADVLNEVHCPVSCLCENSCLDGVELCHFRNVSACDEGSAFTCQDRYSGSLISIEFCKSIIELCKDFAVERVERFRSVDRDIRDSVFDFVFQCFKHVLSFLLISIYDLNGLYHNFSIISRNISLLLP